MKIKILAFLILVLLAVSTVFFWSRTKAKEYSRQTKTAGAVTVEVAPKEIAPGGKMVFTLTLDTHSIDLNYDFLDMAVVIDNKGIIYKPESWTGGNGGHHLSGDLVFGELSKKATHIGLNLTGIDGQNVSFDWSL